MNEAWEEFAKEFPLKANLPLARSIFESGWQAGWEDGHNQGIWDGS